MATNHISNKGVIYLQVGLLYVDESNPARQLIADDYEYGKTRYDRQLVSAHTDSSKRFKRMLLLAVYHTDELTQYDRSVIRKHHTEEAILDDGSMVRYASFTYDHFFETLRARKLRLLAERGLIDDGTIFGSVSKRIVVPERIITAHDVVISVDWDCCNDELETRNSDERNFDRD